jgi:hypothetical protein
MPPLGSQNDRISALEEQIRLMENRIVQLEARLATPLRQRNGRWLGVLDGPLSQGSSATVSLWAYDGDAMADTDKNVTAYDNFLGSGGELDSGIKVYIVFLSDSRWYVVSAECN